MEWTTKMALLGGFIGGVLFQVVWLCLKRVFCSSKSLAPVGPPGACPNPNCRHHNLVNASFCAECGWTLALPKPRRATDLLEPVGAVPVPSTTNEFVAREKFVQGKGDRALVKISYLGDNFREWFLKGEGKTEEPIRETRLEYGKLKKSSVDAPILKDLGGEQQAETTLTEVYSLMAKQPKGEDGVLLNNGYANIFYIRDQNGTLRAVFVFWFGGGWLVDARSVEDPGRVGRRRSGVLPQFCA